MESILLLWGGFFLTLPFSRSCLVPVLIYRGHTVLPIITIFRFAIVVFNLFLYIFFYNLIIHCLSRVIFGKRVSIPVSVTLSSAGLKSAANLRLSPSQFVYGVAASCGNVFFKFYSRAQESRGNWGRRRVIVCRA